MIDLKERRKKSLDAIARIREEEAFKVKVKTSKKRGLHWEKKELKKEGHEGG